MEKDESGEFEYYIADDNYIRIPDDDYHAEVIDIKEHDWDKTKKKLYLKFEIFMDGDGGLEYLFMVFNIPLNNKLGPRSKYYRTWKMIHGKAPSRNTQMSPRIFKNKFFKIRTRTVKTYKDGSPRPESEWYSIIDKILLFVRKKGDTENDTHFDD